MTSTATTSTSTAEERIQRLDDQQAITDLVARLGRMLDEKRFADARSILAEDITVHTPGGTSHGPEAAVEQARRNHTVRTQHVITNVLIELDGDRADVGANLIVTFVGSDGEGLALNGTALPEGRLEIGERYRFEAVRGSAGWRLRSIAAERIWSSRPIPAGALISGSTAEGPNTP